MQAYYLLSLLQLALLPRKLAYLRLQMQAYYLLSLLQLALPTRELRYSRVEVPKNKHLLQVVCLST